MPPGEYIAGVITDEHYGGRDNDYIDAVVDDDDVEAEVAQPGHRVEQPEEGPTAGPASLLGLALADDTSPASVARAMNAFGSLFIDMPKVAEAFRGNGALSWGAHHPCLFSGTEWFFRTGYRAELPNWIAALDDRVSVAGDAAVDGVGDGNSRHGRGQRLRHGREILFRVDPRPLRVAARWFERTAHDWDARLEALKRAAEVEE